MNPYYQDSAVTIYHGDCREWLRLFCRCGSRIEHDSLGGNVCSGCGDSEIACDCPWVVLVTDPPYGVGLGSHAAALDGRTEHVLVKGGYASYDDTLGNFLTIIVPTTTVFLERCKRGMVFCAGDRAWHMPRPSALGGVFLPAAQGRTVWGFNSFAHCLLYGAAPGLNLGCKAIGISSTDAAVVNGHPVPKPYRWMQWAVDLATQQGDTIIDPFMGSGTTLRAAKDLGRKAIGIEIEERYCEIAARRCSQEVLSL